MTRCSVLLFHCDLKQVNNTLQICKVLLTCLARGKPCPLAGASSRPAHKIIIIFLEGSIKARRTAKEENGTKYFQSDILISEYFRFFIYSKKELSS